MHRVVEHEVEEPTTLKCSNEITVTIKITTCNNKSSAVDEMDDRLDIDTGQKVGELLCPFRARGMGLHNTMLPGPRPSSVSSGILLQFALVIVLRPNSITLSWSQTGPKLVADLQRAGIWPII